LLADFNADTFPMALRVLACLTLFLLVPGQAALACKDQPGPFLQQLAAVSKACTHSLCGRIYPTAPVDPATAKSSCSDEPWMRFRSDVTAALSAHGALLLGEMHDNPAHHLLQAAAVTEFAVSGSKDAPAIVFEQIRDDQQAGLDRFADFNRNATRLATVGDLKRFLDWDKSGWPKDIYDPLFKAVIADKLAIYPGDVPRAAIMKTAKKGESSLPAAERTRLGLDSPLGARLDAASLKGIEDAHCGALPKSAFGGMAYAQRYRDAHLADAVLKASDRHGGAFLIAGTEHVRTDRGVPWYLRQRASGKKVVSLMFVEVEDGNTDPGSYVPRDPDGKPAADYLVFTPRADRPDPCERMRRK